VRLEFLPGPIALALQSFTCPRRQTQQLADSPVDGSDDRVVPIEVAGLAGSEIGDPEIVGDLRWAPPPVDPVNQRNAGRIVEEAPDDE
jgi:hypothetical protein